MKKTVTVLAAFLIFFLSFSRCLAADALSEEEKLLICRAVRSETEGEPYLAKIALSAVIINRLGDEGFPDNIHDIVTDRGAFLHLDDVRQLGADELCEEMLALDCVISDGIDPTCGSVFYMKEDDVHLWEIHESFRVGKSVFGKPKKSP